MEKSNHAILAKFFKTKREEVGLSQSKVAEYLGYKSAQFISNWERGLCEPPFEKLATLMHLYKIERNELIDIVLENTKAKLLHHINQAESDSSDRSSKELSF